MAEVIRATETNDGTPKGESDSRLMAAISWGLAPISSLVFILLDNYKKDQYVQYYSWLSLAYSVSVYVISLIINVLTLGMGVCLTGPVMFVLWLVGIWKAYQGEKWVLPYISEWAEKQVQKTVSSSGTTI